MHKIRRFGERSLDKGSGHNIREITVHSNLGRIVQKFFYAP